MAKRTAKRAAKEATESAAKSAAEDAAKKAVKKAAAPDAIDLNAKPGTDPSHPAFYLPAQEIIAGNARGFWAVDPCHKDGQSCNTGDEC